MEPNPYFVLPQAETAAPVQVYALQSSFDDFDQEIEVLDVPEKFFEKKISKKEGTTLDSTPYTTKKHHFKSEEQLYAEMLQRQQKEKNRRIAERLSPVAKYKVQELMRRNRIKNQQRRKFSIMLGVPYEKKAAPVANRNRYSHPIQQAVHEIESDSFSQSTSFSMEKFQGAHYDTTLPSFHVDLELD